ncbi:MAG: flippase [Candidatus Moraniibacteriota bacterium]|nr:MAG: flippase [Candidatus Moranbacteria bacterium]
MALARRIAYNVVFNSIAKIASTVLALVAIGFITRYLGKEGFGDYATVLAFFSLFSSLADLGLSTLLAREISRKDAPEPTIIGNVLALRLGTSASVFLIALVFIPFLPYGSDLRLGIALAAASFLVASSSGILNGIFQKRLIMFQVAAIELTGKVLQLGIIILAVFFDWGFIAIVSALFASLFWNAISVYIFARRAISFHLSFDVSFWKSFLRESAPIGLISIVTFTYFKMDTIFLSVLQGSADVGIYNAAYKIIENLTFFPAMIAGLVLPLFSRYILQEPEKFRIVADKTFKVFVAFAAPLSIGGFFLAEDLARLIGGSEFVESAAPLRFLIFALGAIFFGNFFNAILIAGNKQKYLLIVLSGVALINIAANLVLIPQFSYMAAAFTSLGTESLVAFATAFLASKLLGYRPSFEGIIGILFSAFLMGSILFFFQNLPFPLLLLFGIVSYLLSLSLTGSITKNELELLFSRSSSSKEASLLEN